MSDEAWHYKAIIEDIRKRADADYSSLKQATDVEIERLKTALQVSKSNESNLESLAVAQLKEKDAEIERLKKLLTRAADALKRSHLNGGTILLNSDCEVCKLIQELTETLQ